MFHILFGDFVIYGKFLITAHILVGLARLGAGSFEICFGHLIMRFVITRIDLGQELTILYRLVIIDINL